MSKKINETLLDVGAGTGDGAGSVGLSQQGTPTSGKRYIGQSGEDFPVMDDEEYVTHRAIEWLSILEAKDDEKEEETPPEEAPPEETAPPEEPPVEPPADEAVAEDPNAMAADPNADPNAMDPNAMDPNAMGGMPGMDPMGGMGFTSTEIGRIYELKKIYSRLMTVEAFLGDETNEEMIQLRSSVSKAIDLFETLIANVQAYKDKLDEIIINYYKFVQQVFNEIRTYYKSKSLKDKEVK